MKKMRLSFGGFLAAVLLSASAAFAAVGDTAPRAPVLVETCIPAAVAYDKADKVAAMEDAKTHASAVANAEAVAVDARMRGPVIASRHSHGTAREYALRASRTAEKPGGLLTNSRL